MNGPAFPSILNEMIKERIDKGGETDDEELMKAITSVMYIGEQVQTSFYFTKLQLRISFSWIGFSKHQYYVKQDKC